MSYLKKDNSVTIHQRNLQLLLIGQEVFKAKQGMAPAVISEVFKYIENPLYYVLTNKKQNVVFTC
jgi:hypothetical protein